tara:strand:+ start:697 stop:963 length:267 start_codon:yes stop_codon:yes gene_type:complete
LIVNILYKKCLELIFKRNKDVLNIVIIVFNVANFIGEINKKIINKKRISIKKSPENISFLFFLLYNKKVMQPAPISQNLNGIKKYAAG